MSTTHQHQRPLQNNLAQSQSAYLRSAAHQPIDWLEFTPTAFARAKELDKPVLLDIGAVWCHWCHVIDRESYENDEIAAYINEHYVAIKVDRDQRPDIDARYQNVIASMTGRGGWPLTGFLAHDGRVIYGGTYFPPDQMLALLKRIKDLYDERKDEIFQPHVHGPGCSHHDHDHNHDEEAAEPVTPEQLLLHAKSFVQTQSDAMLQRVLDQAKQTFDPTHGGFGGAPKFPHFSTLSLLIAQGYQNPDEASRKNLRHIVETSLTAMALGGINDQVAGGLHRYSVDEHWHVPHFEKMAYDNAEALSVYSQAYVWTQNPLFKDTAEAIANFSMTVLGDPKQGGFYASQDADIDLEDDGDYFTWTIDEMKAVLSPADVEVAIVAYAMTPEGTMHGRPKRCVLRRDVSITKLAERFASTPDAMEAQLESIRQTLLTERAKRQTPFIDTTLYLNWNGMQASAFLEAGMLLKKPEWVRFAQRSIERINRLLVNPQGQLCHSEGVPAFLDDIAWWIRAHLMAYQATGTREYLAVGQQWFDQAIEQYFDHEIGGFFDTPKSIRESDGLTILTSERKPVEDSPSSSANGIMVQNAMLLSALVEDEYYQDIAQQTCFAFQEPLVRYGTYVSALMTGLTYADTPLTRFSCADDVPAETVLAIQSTLLPGRCIHYNKTTEHSDPNEVRICQGTQCLAPVFTAEALAPYIQVL